MKQNNHREAQKNNRQPQHYKRKGLERKIRDNKYFCDTGCSPLMSRK